MNLFPSLRIILICFLVLGLGTWLVITKFDDWLKQATCYYVHHKTGFPIQIGDLKTDFSNGTIRITDLVLINPSSYSDTRFLRINDIKLHIQFFSLFSSKVVIPELVLDIDELCVVCDQQGKLNLSDFAKAFRAPADANQPITDTPPVMDANKNTFLIERFFFRLNQITIADYRDSVPVTKSARVGISRVFNNITNLQQIILPLAGDLSIFLSDFILDDFLQSTIDTKFSQKLLKIILSPFKDTTEKLKKDSEKLFHLFLPESKPSN